MIGRAVRVTRYFFAKGFSFMTEAKHQANAYLASQPVGKLLLKFSLPCVLFMLVSALYNIVDQIFIGQSVGYLGNAATNVVYPFTAVSYTHLAGCFTFSSSCCLTHTESLMRATMASLSKFALVMVVNRLRVIK